MERIEVKDEVISYKYKAIDGTEFKSEENCKMYEDTAACIIKARLNIKTFDKNNPLVYGSEKDTISIESGKIEIVSGKPEDIAMYVKLKGYIYSFNEEKIIKNIINLKKERLMLFYNSDNELWKVITVTYFVNNIINKLNE